jgi:hypothetical protein
MRRVFLAAALAVIFWTGTTEAKIDPGAPSPPDRPDSSLDYKQVMALCEPMDSSEKFMQAARLLMLGSYRYNSLYLNNVPVCLP